MSVSQFREQYVGGSLALLASGAQTTLFDHDVAVTWGTSPGQTSTFAWKFSLEVDIDAAAPLHPLVHVLVLPAGAAVPSIITSDLISNQALYHWMTLFPSFAYVNGTDTRYWFVAVPKSTRRFNKGDRLVAILFNPGGGAAYGATSIFQGHYEVLYKAAG